MSPVRQAHLVETVRAAEEVALAALPDGALMQRAATGLTVAVADFLGGCYGRRVLLLIGSGDNGGDALYAGAMLARRGAAVEAVLLSEHAHRAGLAEFTARGGRVVRAEQSAAPDVVVDGIVGIGGRPGLRPDAVAALERHRGVPVVAVDVPSGVDVETGELPGPHVRAALTVTFGTYKPAHLLDPAAAACGAVTLVDLGLRLPEAPLAALQRQDVAALLPVPGPFAHKYTRGVLGVRAGSAEYPGAAVLCVAGAAAGLVGMVRYDGPAAASVVARYPGTVTAAGRVQAWVVGSGTGAGAAQALERSLADGVPCVVDADALTVLAGRSGTSGSSLVLTPHAGELAAMLGIERSAVEARQWESARTAAQRFGAVVVLKGRHTVTADPSGRARVTTTGLPWLAVAGAGDVLAGVIGSLLAAGLEPFDAASVGYWLHGAAATLAAADGPLRPESVAEALAAVVRDLLG